jgi:hypothetical protein
MHELTKQLAAAKLETEKQKHHGEPFGVARFLRLSVHTNTSTESLQLSLTPFSGSFTQKLDTILENQIQLENRVTFALLSGALSSRIIIQTEIPSALLDGSIHGSKVGGSGDESDRITTFVKNQLLPKTEEWQTPVLPVQVNSNINLNTSEAGKNARELQYLRKAVGSFGVVDVNNDNQFNIKVDIQDSKKQSTHLTARVDFLVVPSKLIDKAMPILDIFKSTVVFIEVESGSKGMELAELQLMTSLMAISHLIGNGCVYGIVITANFDLARLIKFDRMGCYSDGTFHPSQLGAVATMILKREIS